MNTLQTIEQTKRPKKQTIETKQTVVNFCLKYIANSGDYMEKVPFYD